MCLECSLVLLVPWNPIQSSRVIQSRPFALVVASNVSLDPNRINTFCTFAVVSRSEFAWHRTTRSVVCWIGVFNTNTKVHIMFIFLFPDNGGVVYSCSFISCRSAFASRQCHRMTRRWPNVEQNSLCPENSKSWFWIGVGVSPSNSECLKLRWWRHGVQSSFVVGRNTYKTIFSLTTAFRNAYLYNNIKDV